ncbi:MAG: DUF6159 family protein [Ilumatobacteraceae bacterium]
MFERMRQGWQLTKKSWGVVRTNPGLIRLPIYGGLLALACAVVFCLPGAYLLSRDEGSSAAMTKVAGVALVVVGAYLASFFVIYFNVALAAAADQALRGQAPDLRAARAVARGRIGVIAAWAAVSAAVSAFFALLRDKGGIAGNIGAGVGAAIWGLITFMVVPVLAFEGIGPVAAIKRSASLFRQRWGQQVTGNVVIGGVAGLIVLVGVLAGVGGIALLAGGEAGLEVLGAALLLLGVVLAVAGSVFAGATRGVFGTALYRYIADNHAVGPFSAPELESAVRTR